jgi:PIN domain nuclease of toxin-antitoxin system
LSGALLLDTHIALWLESGSDRLRTPTRALIEACWQGGGVIYLSAVSAWEIAQLAHAGRFELDVPAATWVRRFLDGPGVSDVPLSHAAAIRAYSLHGFPHRDPADRLLVATALELGCPLVTYDERIASFAIDHGQHYGFAVAG